MVEQVKEPRVADGSPFQLGKVTRSAVFEAQPPILDEQSCSGRRRKRLRQGSQIIDGVDGQGLGSRNAGGDPEGSEGNHTAVHGHGQDGAGKNAGTQGAMDGGRDEINGHELSRGDVPNRNAVRLRMN
jgi:hypothetical protein